MAHKKIQPRTAKELAAFDHWLRNPVDAVKDWFKVTPDDWQGDLLNALFTKTDRVAMKAAHGPGKTTIDAWAGWIFLNCYEDSRVVATAPTFAQLHDVLFPEYSKWHAKFPDRIADEWVLSSGHIRHKDVANRKYSQTWFAVARTSNQPANLQGFHGSHILIEADEASAITPPVFEVIEGALSEAGDEGKVAKLLMGGNPNFNSGELHDAFYKNRDMYHRITITGHAPLLNELNVEQGDTHPEHGRVYYSPRVKKKYADNIAKKYGLDSAVYDVRVRGVFPRASDDAIFPLEWVQRATLLELPNFDAHADAFDVIVDPSRGGAAETAIGVARNGIVIEVMGHKGRATTPIVANLVHEVVIRYKQKGLRLGKIICDLPGVGGGVIDLLRRDFNYPVQEYDGGKPLVAGVDPEDECRMFGNKRARDHWVLRRKLEAGTYPLPMDDVMVAQMASIKYKYSKTNEKIFVESKDDMKDRLGPEASPDRSDIIVMAQAPDYRDDGTTHIQITQDDLMVGEDRDTAVYRDELEAGLV